MQPHTVADLIRAIYLALFLHGHLTPLILGHIISYCWCSLRLMLTGSGDWGTDETLKRTSENKNEI